MYVDYFQLRAEPFGLTPDPAFLYLSPGHREALAAVQYGLLDRRGFITMVGEVGTGKTTLLYSMLSRLDREVEAAYIAYTTQDFEDVLASALADLGVETTQRSKHALLTAFNAHLLRRADEGRTVALVIDEAQNLTDRTFEELRLASNFETYSRKLLQIVLVGQPELQDRLQQPQLRQLRERVSVRAFVNPLSSAEMYRYIEHRLQLVGGSSHVLFTSQALRQIVRRAAGVPRRANILCHNALLFAYGREQAIVTAKIAGEVIAEMDDRRPGWLRRRALKSLRQTPTPLRWTAGVVGSALALVAIERAAFFESYHDDEVSAARAAKPEEVPVPTPIPPPVAASPPVATPAPIAAPVPAPVTRPTPATPSAESAAPLAPVSGVPAPAPAAPAEAAVPPPPSSRNATPPRDRPRAAAPQAEQELAFARPRRPATAVRRPGSVTRLMRHVYSRPGSDVTPGSPSRFAPAPGDLLDDATGGTP